MGGTLLAIETSQSWDRPGEQGEDEEVVWSMSPSGPLDPCFIIFLYLERLFWNHIFTLSKQNRNKKNIKIHLKWCNNWGHIFLAIKASVVFSNTIFSLWYWGSLNSLCRYGLCDTAVFHYSHAQQLFRPAIFMKAVKHVSDNNNHSVKIHLNLVELKWLPESLFGRFW